MDEDRKKVLEMLAEGKIGVDEAERLLAATAKAPGADPGGAATAQVRRRSPKYFRVTVEPNVETGSDARPERVNIRIPMALVRAGVKFSTLIPAHAAAGVNEAIKKSGFDFDVRSIKAEDLDSLVDALSDLTVDVQTGDQNVRIFVE